MEKYVGLLTKNLFSPGDFDLQSLHQEKNRRKQIGDDDDDPSALRGDDGTAINERGVKAKGRIDVYHPIFGRKGEESMKDLCKIAEHDDYVFSGIPDRLRSPLFTVTAKGYVGTGAKIRGKWRVVRVVQVEWEPRPMTSDVLEVLMDTIGMNPDEADLLVGDGPITSDDQGQPVYDSGHFFSVASNHEKQTVRDKLYHLEHCKMYFRSEVFKVLSPTYYDEETVACLNWDDMDPIVQHVKTKPHELCFTRLIQYKHEPPPGYSHLAGSFLNSPDGLLKLPELTFNQLLASMNAYVDLNQTEEWQVVAVIIYDELKIAMNRDKHMYVTHDALIKEYRDFIGDRKIKKTNEDMRNFERAVSWLKDRDIIVVDHKDRYYLSQAFRWELSIATGIEMLMAKALAAPVNPPEVDLKNLRSKHGWPFIDEQIRAFQRFLTYPVLLVDGSAGSGKTAFLECVAAHVPHEKVIATAHNGVNAGQLGKIFPGRAFTTHQLLFHHRMTCKRKDNPLKLIAEMQTSKAQQEKIIRSLRFKVNMKEEQKEEEEEGEKEEERLEPKKVDDHAPKQKMHMSKLGIKYRECIGENIAYVIVDEISTQEPETLAELLSISLCCGKAIKFLFLGDRGQLPAIKRGNIAKSLYEALSHLGMAIDFVHNHRVKEGSEILRNLGDSIRLVRPSSVRFDSKIAVNYPLEVKYDAKANEKKSIMHNYIRDVLTTFALKEYKHHIITRTRDYRSKIVEVVEKYYHSMDPNLSGYEHNMRSFWVGRKVCFKQNNHELGISNNEIFVLREVFDVSPKGARRAHKHTSIRLETKEWKRYIVVSPVKDFDRKIELDWEEWARHWITRGSCNTIASYQGSQVEDCIIVQPYYSKFDTRENLYTAFTRAEERLFFLGTTKALERSIRNPEPLRRSALADMIKDCCQRFNGAFEPPDETYADELERQRKSNAAAKTIQTTMTRTVTKTVVEKKITVQSSPQKRKQPTGDEEMAKDEKRRRIDPDEEKRKMLLEENRRSEELKKEAEKRLRDEERKEEKRRKREKDRKRKEKKEEKRRRKEKEKKRRKEEREKKKKKKHKRKEKAEKDKKEKSNVVFIDF